MEKEAIKLVILKYLEEHKGQVTFVELSRVLPEKGEIAIKHPSGENIVIWCEITEAYAEALHELMTSKKIRLDSCSVLPYWADGKILSFPLAKTLRKYKKPHWLPMFINKGEKWESV
jgi:hypothetical protein